MIQRRALLAATPLLASPTILSAQAVWPNDRPVEVIVLAAAGGGVDAMTRLVMPLIAQQIPGMRVVVMNRPGAGGQIGLEATFNAAADGYTLGSTTFPAHNAFPIERQVRYRPLDFTFICNVVEDANCFYVRAESPFRSLPDLVAAAKARPGQLSCGNTGIGSDDHLFALHFEELAGLQKMIHVPFTGTAPLLPQLLGGNLDVAALNVYDALPLVREGRLRILAQAAATRAPEAADVPSFRELGFDLVHGASRGILGPPNMPPQVTEKLIAAARIALASEEFKREAARVFMPLNPILGADYKAFAERSFADLQRLWRVRPWRE
ncbi:MAG: tripartite tricarboxylate transporter substrate binding protein [Alphaproteobacteria bacterium]